MVLTAVRDFELWLLLCNSVVYKQTHLNMLSPSTESLQVSDLLDRVVLCLFQRRHVPTVLSESKENGMLLLFPCQKHFVLVFVPYFSGL